MRPDFIVDGVLRSVLGGRRKRSRRAARYATFGASSLLSNPTALLTAVGVAWGVIESLAGAAERSGSSGVPSGPVNSPGTPPPPTPAPPVPTADEPAAPEVPADAMRLARLALSAANADGSINDRERDAVMQQARSLGVGDLVEREMQNPRPLPQIVAGVTDRVECATLYVLAFTILRADEQLTGAERIYLAQLAHLLGLDPGITQQLETDAGKRIDALGDQAQLGG